MSDKKDNKCLHCAFIDAPYLCENHTCEEGLLLEDNNKMKMEKWDEIYGNKEGYSCGYGGEPL